MGHRAKRDKWAMPILRVHQRIAAANIYERRPASEFFGKRVAPIERNAARAQPFGRISRRQPKCERGSVIHDRVFEREQKLAKRVAHAIRRGSCSGGSRTAHEKKRYAGVYRKM